MKTVKFSIVEGARMIYRERQEIRRNTQKYPSKILPDLGTETGFKRGLKFSRFPRRIRFGCKPNLPDLDTETVVFF